VPADGLHTCTEPAAVSNLYQPIQYWKRALANLFSWFGLQQQQLLSKLSIPLRFWLHGYPHGIARVRGVRQYGPCIRKLLLHLLSAFRSIPELLPNFRGLRPVQHRRLLRRRGLVRAHMPIAGHVRVWRELLRVLGWVLPRFSGSSATIGLQIVWERHVLGRGLIRLPPVPGWRVHVPPGIIWRHQ